MRKRSDTDFYHPEFSSLRRRIDGLADKAQIREILAHPMRSGFAAGKDDQSDSDDFGIPQLRPTNILPDGDIRTEDAIRIPRTNASEEDFLQIGEVLFNNTNSSAWVGKSLFFEEQGTFVCSNHLTRIRPNKQCDPKYLAEVLNLLQSLGYFARLSTNFNNQAGVNIEALEQVVVPLPPLAVQREMVGEMKAARESRRSKLEKAEALLTGLDAFLLSRLGITIPTRDNRLMYAVRLSGLSESKQIGADYFHPERMSAIRAIQTSKKAERAARLEDVADFLREHTTEYEPEQYLGLAGVQSHTGELSETTEEPGVGQASKFNENDVLFARLRPYLNKVWRAENNGVCSTEFHVIRIKENVKDLLSDFLAAVLRSSVVVAQTKHMMTGNTHPRLANEDVVDLLIPIPDEKTQQEIVDELHHRRMEARRLREVATREWEAAKARFEVQLLGPLAE